MATKTPFDGKDLNGKHLSNQPVELSQQELDEVSGGIDLYFSTVMFEQIDEFSAQTVSSGDGCGATSVSQSSRTSFSSFQFFGSGFESFGDALSFLKGISRLFGR
jgi:hypothetical protein